MGPIGDLDGSYRRSGWVLYAVWMGPIDDLDGSYMWSGWVL
jgi:hypothetical protein